MIGLNNIATLYKDTERICIFRCRIISEKDMNFMFSGLQAYVDWRLQIITDFEIPILNQFKKDIEIGNYKCEIDEIMYTVQEISKRNASLFRNKIRTKYYTTIILK